MNDNSPVVEMRVVLTVENHAEAVRFWRDALGLPLEREFPGGSLFAAGRATIEILARDEAEKVDELETGGISGSPMRLALQVADSTATGSALEAAGATRLGGPMTAPWGHRSVRLETAEGVEMTLFTVLPPDA